MNWLQATRATAHATVAAVITFSRFHSGTQGLQTLMLFGVLYLAASLGTHLLDHRHKLMTARISVPVIAPVVTALAALAVSFTSLDPVQSFRWLTAFLALGFTVTELWLAKKVGRKSVDGRDATITAFAALALLILMVAFDMGKVPMVGFFGAFHAILAVHLGISAASPKK